MSEVDVFETENKTLVPLPEGFDADSAFDLLPAEPSANTILHCILGDEEMPPVNTDEATVAILLRVLTSDTIDEVLGQGVEDTETLIDHPIRVNDVRWMPSDFTESGKGAEKGPNCYAVVSAKRLADDKSVKFTVGAATVQAQLWRLRFGGGFPVTVILRRKKTPTSAGFYPMWLEPA